MTRITIILSMLFCLSACVSTPVEVSNAPTGIHDEVFPDHILFPVETHDEVFKLSDEAIHWVNTEVNTIRDNNERMRTLVRKIFDRSEFNLLYMGNANTTAADTFANHAANCLSMSIMTYALAKEAQFSAVFQDIEIPEYWTRRDGYSLLNGHVNLKLLPKSDPLVVRLMETGMTVDFDPQERRKKFPIKRISANTVLAMFYNNKGADALVSNQYSKAYSYFRAAIMEAPGFDSSYVNLGFLYRMQDQYDYAEESYKKALELNPSNLTAQENMAVLYEYQGKWELAKSIQDSLRRKRLDNPYYHYMMGEALYDEEDFEGALEHYRDALRLDKSKHEIYFGLAKTHFQLGDVLRSKRYLARARKLSNNEQDQERYQGKLDLLTRRN